MSRIRTFLSTLTDRELAFFSRYMLPTYMKATREEILSYLKERGITVEKIQDHLSQTYIREKDDDKPRCPRCASDKIRRDTVEWVETDGKAGYADEIAALDGLAGKATYKDNVICNICGFWLSDPNDEKPNGWLSMFFDRFR